MTEREAPSWNKIISDLREVVASAQTIAQARYETALKCAEMFPETMHESTLRIYLAIRAYAATLQPSTGESK